MTIQPSSSPWAYKPWWCQPWSIVLTGIMLIGSSWVLTKTLWITVLVAFPVLLWMAYFVFIWPSLMKRYQQQMQDSVTQVEN